MGAFEDAIKYSLQYLVLAILFSSIYMILDNKYSKKVRIIDIVATIVLVSFSGLRYYVGSDFEEYFLRYSHYVRDWNTIVERITTEKLFFYVCHWFSLLSDSEYGIFWLCALIQYPILIVVARKITGRPSRVIMFYIFLELYSISNNILRQSISAEFVMLGYLALKKEKRLLGLALLFIATGFHLTAIIGIVLVFLGSRIKPTKNYYYGSVIIGIIITLFWNPIIAILEKVPTEIRYVHYFEDKGHYVVRYGMIAYVIFYSLIFFWLMRYKDKVLTSNDDTNFETTYYSGVYNDSIAFILISIPLFFLGMQVSYFYRLSLYLYPFTIFSLSDVWAYHMKGKRRDINVKIKIAFSLIVWLFVANIISLDNTYWQIQFRGL